MTYLLSDAQEPEIPLLVKNKAWYSTPSEETEERIEPPTRSAFSLADQFSPHKEVRTFAFPSIRPLMKPQFLPSTRMKSPKNS